MKDHNALKCLINYVDGGTTWPTTGIENEVPKPVKVSSTGVKQGLI